MIKKSFSFFRKIIAIILIVFSSSGLIPILDSIKTHPIDIADILITIVIMLLLFTFAFILYPKNNFLESIPAVTNVKAHPMDDNPLNKEKNLIHDKLIHDKIENKSESNILKSARDKYVVITPLVVGTIAKVRQQSLEVLINKLKSEGYFYELYENMNDTEIINDYLTRDEEYPVWELTEEILPFATIKLEPLNSMGIKPIAVYVGSSEEDAFKVAYILDRDADKIHNLIANTELIDVIAIIKGGKSKVIFYNHYGQEQIHTRSSFYALDIKVLFLK